MVCLEAMGKSWVQMKLLKEKYWRARSIEGRTFGTDSSSRRNHSTEEGSAYIRRNTGLKGEPRDEI